MNSTATHFTVTKKSTFQSTLWLTQGWSLFLKAPFTLFVFMLGALIIEGIVQQIPAPLGVVVSKLIMAILMASIWPLLDQIHNTGSYSLRGFAAFKGWVKLPALSLLLVTPAFIQILVAMALLGRDGLDLIVFGKMIDISALQISIIFSSATPFIILFAFVPAYVLLKNESSVGALRKGIAMVFSAWRPLSVILVINIIVISAVPYTFLLSAILLGPWLACVNYAAFQNLINHPRVDA